MHFMIIGALLHVTVLGVIAFFILFAASRAEGFVALLGRLLGYWILLLALAGLAFGIFGAVTGRHMMGPGWMMHHRGWDHMGPPGTWNEPVPPPTGAPATPAPEQPAKPAPATPAKPAKPG
jgi:hypothetical protein